MWVLIQTNKDKSREKYIVTKNYDDIITYIHGFTKIKKYSDYFYVSGEELFFNIRLAEYIGG